MTRSGTLLRWHSAHRRDLPWRRERAPYLVLVSEIMLQQTQADRVSPRFESFIARFPSEEALAEAPLGDVLDEWRGLGYNSRARRLRDACRIVVDEGWPTTVPGLLALPGVGPYTARAIAALAFGLDEVAVDTNVRRVVTRWHGSLVDDSTIAEFASREIPSGAFGEWIEAVMDLGATVCRPREPQCHSCPVSEHCADPTLRSTASRQSRFEGSIRQTRARVLDALSDGPQDLEGLRSSLPEEHSTRIQSALDGLASDGMIDVEGTSIAIAD